MTSDEYDLVVIKGGGNNGAGVARAKVAAGYKALVLQGTPPRQACYLESMQD